METHSGPLSVETQVAAELAAPDKAIYSTGIAVIEDEEVIYRILSHLKLLSPGDGPLG